jgi:hypothetical protein
VQVVLNLKRVGGGECYLGAIHISDDEVIVSDKGCG